MLLSYSISPEDLPYGYHRSTSYDNALAALAFMVMGERDRAAFTLHALTRVARPDGSLWFGYNTANDWPSEKDHESALVRAGAIGWVGYAFTFYLTQYPTCPLEDRACGWERARFLQAAVRAADYLLSLEIRDPGDPRDGLIPLGVGQLDLAYRSDLDKVVEVYSARTDQGISTENNISTWFFLRQLAQLTGDVRHRQGADRIRDALLRFVWNDQLSQFNQGFHASGAADSTQALDCASWGALFLSAIGEHSKAQRALALLHTRYASQDGGSAGLRPYAGVPVYPDPEVGRFYFPDSPRMAWQDLPLVWSEGTLGAALAFLRVGQPGEAGRLAEGLSALRVDGGGLLYASRDLPFHMVKAPGVAASAWLVLVTEAMAGNPVAERVWQ